MKRIKNILSIKCKATDQDFVITKHTPNIVLNSRTGEVNIIVETTKKDYDLTFDEKFYKIVDTIDVYSLSNLAKLFEGRSVKFRKYKGEKHNETKKGDRI